MGVIVATTAGLILWLVMWALGVKAFDAFMITVDKLAIVVGDVVGKGLEAARRSTFVRAMVTACAPYLDDPAAILLRQGGAGRVIRASTASGRPSTPTSSRPTWW